MDINRAYDPILAPGPIVEPGSIEVDLGSVEAG